MPVALRDERLHYGELEDAINRLARLLMAAGLEPGHRVCLCVPKSPAAVVGMLAMNGLPMPYHPVFNVPRFAAASSDGFFLTIETADPKYDVQGTRRFLDELHPLGVSDIAA